MSDTRESKEEAAVPFMTVLKVTHCHFIVFYSLLQPTFKGRGIKLYVVVVVVFFLLEMRSVAQAGL